ncbi:GspE/PulE family protein, partial [Candidatus Magnetaquicoccus inordinatus]|uniref:GspE/PulE family protein n=1 Tax=Candidatus Magnetaquicoccus inordinatus TaxID=2496818 RepID=UPI00187D6A55
MRHHDAGTSRFDQALVKLGLVNDKDLANVKAQLLGLPLVQAGEYPVTPVLDGVVNSSFFLENHIVPLCEAPHGLQVAVADPLDTFSLQALKLRYGKPIFPKVGVPAEIEAALKLQFPGIQNSSGEASIVSDDDLERLKDQAAEGPVIKLVEQLIERAVEFVSSDIHVEPFEDVLRVRFRRDGLLTDEETFPKNQAAPVISRIKIIARLDFAERRLPQDGRIRMAVRGKLVDFRVSTTPTLYGESVVLRILDKSAVLLELSALGFGADMLIDFRKALH